MCCGVERINRQLSTSGRVRLLIFWGQNKYDEELRPSQCIMGFVERNV